MPLVPFSALSDSSRVWVFGTDRPLEDPEAAALAALVHDFLSTWVAHGRPLRCSSEWRDGRFLVVGVDENATQASGCSIDGLYRKLRDFGQQRGVSLLSRDFVFFRDADGEVRSVSREEFARLSANGAIVPDTIVFDTSVTTLTDLRVRFELPAAGSWHRALLTV